MEDKEKTLEYFFIETKPDYSTEKITSFFTKSNNDLNNTKNIVLLNSF